MKPTLILYHTVLRCRNTKTIFTWPRACAASEAVPGHRDVVARGLEPAGWRCSARSLVILLQLAGGVAA
jgi:hypothetical protein